MEAVIQCDTHTSSASSLSLAVGVAYLATSETGSTHRRSRRDGVIHG